MAGRFINNEKKNTIDTLTQSFKENILKNQYYMYSDKKGAIAQYYNLNTTQTTLDSATGSNYAELGPNSPFRFNLIKDTFLYGIDKIGVNLEVGDNGLEAGEISGEAIVIPDTFVPYVGDFFTLDQIGNDDYLFRVNEVQPNILDSGATMYKINYDLAYTQGLAQNIDNQVVEEFNMILDNAGTNLKTVVESTKYDFISELEKYTVKLKDYFIMLFYNSDVQTFVYLHNGIVRAYDPYLVEFISRNNILKGSTEFIDVSQQMELQQTFGIDYDRTIFSAIEERDCETRNKILYVGNLLLVTQRMSLLYAYYEDYYYMQYYPINNKFFLINIFGEEHIDIIWHIRNNVKTGNILTDIMIKYFNDEDITDDDILKLKNIDYQSNKELFYGIPIVIFCLERIIINLLT